MTQIYLQSTERLALKLIKTGNFTDTMVGNVVGFLAPEVKAIRADNALPKVKKLGDRKQLSSAHWLIGNKLLALRLFDGERCAKEIALKIGWTERKYTRVESGKFLLTLIDLELLAKHFSCTITDIINCQFGS